MGRGCVVGRMIPKRIVTKTNVKKNRSNFVMESWIACASFTFEYVADEDHCITKKVFTNRGIDRRDIKVSKEFVKV
jgi:hypothetical protein